MRRRSLARLAAASIALSAFTAAGTSSADTWTVLVYMEANNSLEPFANETFDEMMKVGKTKVLTSIVEVDTGKHKSTQKIDGMPSGSGVKRVLVRKGSVDSESDDVGDDMTTSKGLANFIKYGIKKHSADHYALVLWDHGAGWHGCCEAETPELRGMALDTIAKGIENGLKGGPDKLDVVAFDECLMGELDVANALAPFVKVMVASEELEPGEGMDYDKWLKAIANDDSITPDGVGKAIADAYVDHIENQSGNPAFTLSVLELKHIDELTAAAARLAKQLEKASNDSWEEIGAARAKSDQYGGQQADLFGLIDLGQFAKFVGNIDGVSASEDVASALDKVVKYKVAGPMHKKSKGISVYLPENEMDGDYTSVAFSEKWTKLAEDYAKSAGKDTEPPDTEDVDIEEEPEGGGGGGAAHGGKRSTLALTGLGNDKDLAQVNLVLAEDQGDDKHVFLGEVPLKDAEQLADDLAKDPKANDKINYDWNGTWPMVTDGKTTTVVPLYAVKEYDSDDGAGTNAGASGTARKMAVVEMPAELDDGSGGGFAKSIRVQFELDLTKLEGKMIGAFEVAKIGAGAIKLTPDEKVRPYEVLVADKGKYTQKPGSTTFTGSLSMVSQKLPDKKYMLGVHLVDYAGNQSTKLVDVSQLLAKAAQQQQQQKTGCAKKCAVGFDAEDESGWIGAVAVGGLMTLRRRRRRAR